MGLEEMTNAVCRLHCLGRRKFSVVRIRLLSWQIKGLDCHYCRADECKGPWEAHRTACFWRFPKAIVGQLSAAPADEQIPPLMTASSLNIAQYLRRRGKVQ